jgi:hypothetical protein
MSTVRVKAGGQREPGTVTIYLSLPTALLSNELFVSTRLVVVDVVFTHDG